MTVGTADRIFEILQQKKELPHEPREGRLGAAMKKWSFRFLVAAFACFPLLGTVALIFTSSARRLESLSLLGQGVAVLMAVLALLSQLTEIVRAFCDLVHFKSNAYDSLRKTFAHDVRNAGPLDRFSVADLEYIDKWLALRIDRMKLRLGMFLGGADKVAVFALAGTGWTVWHNLRNGGTSWEDKLTMYGLACLAGLAFGGILMNVLIKELSYQRDMLALAIERKKRPELLIDALVGETS